jgi:hypothetical protein
LYNLDYSGKLHAGAIAEGELSLMALLLHLIQSTDSSIIWNILEGLAGGRAESFSTINIQFHLISAAFFVLSGIFRNAACGNQLEGKLMALCSN